METMKRFKRVLSCMLSLFLVYSTLILIRPIEVNASVNDTSGYELITEAKKHLELNMFMVVNPLADLIALVLQCMSFQHKVLL